MVSLIIHTAERYLFQVETKFETVDIWQSALHGASAYLRTVPSRNVAERRKSRDASVRTFSGIRNHELSVVWQFAPYTALIM